MIPKVITNHIKNILNSFIAEREGIEPSLRKLPYVVTRFQDETIPALATLRLITPVYQRTSFCQPPHAKVSIPKTFSLVIVSYPHSFSAVSIRGQLVKIILCCQYPLVLIKSLIISNLFLFLSSKRIPHEYPIFIGLFILALISDLNN